LRQISSFLDFEIDFNFYFNLICSEN
jgi:hypothetical protein